MRTTHFHAPNTLHLIEGRRVVFVATSGSLPWLAALSRGWLLHGWSWNRTGTAIRKEDAACS